MNRTLYTLLFHLGLPLVALRLWWRARQAPAYAKRIGERFSLSLPEVPPGGIWVHAVSVGESIAAAPMVRALLERHPQLPVTVTCMTPTGSERIRALFGEQVRHCYLPYDLPWAAARFLDRVRPRLAVIMETELWPNHIHACAVRGIPVALANARLSERSARGYARFAGLTRPMLAELSWIAVQTEAEAERFRRLGARPECVSVTGSIKFDLRIDPQLPLAAAALREEWDATARPLWIAASTHAGEDEIVLAAHRRLLETRPDALLILVPRHPERFAGVHELCRREGFATVRRSGGEPVARATQVLLGDTMGELLFLYALADIAFVGGSLVPNGGHNLLEPAALGKPVFAGPHLFNFLDIAAQLRDAGALLEVTDAGELCDGLARLWAQPEVATAMATAGEKVLRNNQGALERLLAGLARLLGRGGESSPRRPSPGPASRQGVSERRRGDHPEHQGIAVARVAVAMRFLAGVAEAVALAELEMAVADPEFEDSAEDVAGFLALMAVALLAVGARRETRVEDLQLAAGLRGEQFVDDAVFVMHAHARVAPHHVAGVRRVHRGLAGEEPLDGHAEAAGDVEQRRNRRIRQVAFQLADVAGGEFALCGQLGQGQAAALAQAADAGAEEVRFAARRVGGVRR